MRAAIICVVALTLAGCSGDDAAAPDPDPSFCDLVAEGAECDDGNPCTLLDRCRAGVCAGGDLVTCDAPDACHLAGSCDPVTGACVNPARADGSSCDDGDLCTQLDACQSGVCVGASPVVCRRLDECRLTGVCDPSTGVCSHPLAPSGAPCSDGDACTTVDTCRAGVCVGAAPKDCGEADACGGAGVCIPSTGECVRELEPNGTPCDDDDRCSTVDTCRDGVCTGSVPLDCSTTNPCRIATGCAPDAGCLYVDQPLGAPCNDGDACTSADHCAAGVCTSTTSVTCVALDQCHDPGVCDPVSGCSNPPKSDGASCDDGDACTIVATCEGGACAASVTVQCPLSPSACLANGQCDAASGECFFPPMADGTGCNDQNTCTTADACVAGQCAGTRIPPAVQPCAEGVCFTAVTSTVGITFTSTATMMMGAGAAFLDYDGDGMLDIALGSEGLGVRIFRNLGGTFVDVSAAVGITALPPGDLFMGFAVADYDNDGDDDLYFVVHGANRLYRNDLGVFVDVTAAMGVGDPRWSTGAAFGDYDGDGDLDLYVGNYVQVPNFPSHGPFPNTLYRNDGATFTDVSVAAGVAGAGTTLSVSWTDFDGDGDADLFVCNDFGAFVEPNQLYRNDGGVFVEVSQAMNFDIGIFCMGIAASDYDGDLDLDYYFSNLGRNVLLRNDGTQFVDVTVPTGTALATDMCRAPLLTTSWGAGFQDFDQDGVEELYVSNGHIPAAGPIANAEDSPNSLLARGAPYRDISVSAGVDDRQVGRGVAFGDYDNDGDIDVLQANVVGDAILLRNDSPNTGGFLGVDLVGRSSNRDGFGARLEARTGAVTQVREANANYGYESSSHKRVHFGGVTVVDELVVRWPSGVPQTLFDVPGGMAVLMVEPAVTATITSAPPASPGQTITVVAELVNHTDAAVTVDYALQLRSGSTIASGDSGARVVAAQATVSVAATVVVPAGAVGAAAVVLTTSESQAITQIRRMVSIP